MSSALLSRLFGQGSVYEALRGINDGDLESEMMDEENGMSNDTQSRRSMGAPYIRHEPTIDENEVPPSIMIEEGTNMPNYIPTSEDHGQESQYTRPINLGRSPFSRITPKERALWLWTNVENLDNFLIDV